MSYTSVARFGELTDDDILDRRTVAEIQRKIIKQSGNNPVSRLFHAKNDKETIATWRLDLDRIIHVFNVCSVGSAPLSLTTPFQTELALNTHLMVSDLHQNLLIGKGSVDEQHRPVSTTLHPSTTGYLPSPRLRPGQLS